MYEVTLLYILLSGRPTPSSSRSSFRQMVDATTEVTHSKEHATPTGSRPSAVEFDVVAQQPSSYLLCCADWSCTYTDEPSPAALVALYFLECCARILREH